MITQQLGFSNIVRLFCPMEAKRQCGSSNGKVTRQRVNLAISFKLTSSEGTRSAPLQPQEHGEHIEHDEHIEHMSTQYLNNALIINDYYNV